MARRNCQIDYIRGLAILMVILGHTISNNGIADYSQSGLYKIIFALQMPLFMLISGYVFSLSSGKICSRKEFFSFIRRKSIAYLQPWLVWTIIRGVCFDNWTVNNLLSKFGYLLYHMDTGYWFLFSLWSICVLWGIGVFAANVLCVGHNKRAIVGSGITICIAVLVYFVGKAVDMSFLCIKLTLYYLPFFGLGFLTSVFQKSFLKEKWVDKASKTCVVICTAVFVFLLSQFDIVSAGESLNEIIQRITCSIAGCVLFVCCSRKIYSGCSQSKFLVSLRTSITAAGQRSLELYLLQYLFLNLLVLPAGESVRSPLCFIVCILNYLMTVFLSAGLSWLIAQNQLLNYILFAKSTER